MNNTYDLSKFNKGLQELGLDLSSSQIESFITYYEMLVEKNKVMNLTAITEFDEVILKHFIDSLALASVYELDTNMSVLDLGTGAGFPGMPLAIAFDNLDITLMDSLNKRIKFLDEVIQELELTNVSAIHGRAEEAARKIHREKYDMCLSRAVANISTLSEYCLPFVKVGGFFISYKSGDIEEELELGKKAISKMGGEILEVKKLRLPHSDIDRSFVIIKKISKTPKQYPRKAGTPSKDPIL